METLELPLGFPEQPCESPEIPGRPALGASGKHCEALGTLGAIGRPCGVVWVWGGGPALRDLLVPSKQPARGEGASVVKADSEQCSISLPVVNNLLVRSLDLYATQFLLWQWIYLLEATNHD